MCGMFDGNEVFNQRLDLSDTSQLENMNYLFRDCLNYNQNMNSWNTSAVIRMRGVFKNALVFDQNLAAWDDLYYAELSNFLTIVLYLNAITSPY